MKVLIPYQKGILFLLGFITILLLLYFNTHPFTEYFPLPTGDTQIFEGQIESEGNGNPREEWEKMIHRAAPGTDWKAKDRQHIIDQYKNQIKRKPGAQKSTENFAGGALVGTWSERGSNNQAGSLVEVEYVADSATVYGVSAGGTLWKGNLTGSNWTPLNETLRFHESVLKVIPDGANGQRILAAIGKDIWYSDDDGITWTQSTGLSFFDTWGNPLKMITLNDANNSIYYMVRTWQTSPWSAAVDIYFSKDRGLSFSKIANYPQWNYERIDMWSPFNTADLYLLVNGKELFTIDANDVTLLNTNADLPTDQSAVLTGSKTGDLTTFYALMNRNTVYSSTDEGATWTLKGTTPVSSWAVGMAASPFDNSKLIMGAVDCYISSNEGTSWSKVNEWWQYYNNINLLHADIMDIKPFQTSDGTDFFLIANHGGLHISYDHLATTTNISTAGLNIGQYYDVRTDPTNSNFIYAGAQDQGHQRSSSANSAGVNNFTQVISGDYGHMAFSGGGTSLWTVYPGAWVTFYPSPQTGGYAASYDLGGSTPAVSDWITPTAEIPGTADHEIYLAGGNINGGAGSYLVKLTAQFSGNWSISASQFSYDFRANSTSGSATISAIRVSPLNTSKIFVATSDGTFFYSTDEGVSWNKSNSTGPSQFWLYGSSILASSISENIVWFAGSGYSTDPVLRSIDGGANFTPITNGLPNTLVQEITANSDETILYAATEVGPYAFLTDSETWYSLVGSVPQQQYYSVEYLAGDIVRFGSYGRGIWDFTVSQSEALDLEWIDISAVLNDQSEVLLNWEVSNEGNIVTYEIQKKRHSGAFNKIGNLSASSFNGKYDYIDYEVFYGDNYYRIKSIDEDGNFNFSKTVSVKLESKSNIVKVYPNPVFENIPLNVEVLNDEDFQFVLYNLDGKKLHEQRLTGKTSINLSSYQSGNHFYKIWNKGGKAVKTGKLVKI